MTMDRLASFGRVRGIDPKTHRVTAIVSTSGVARDGFKIDPRGFELDNYKRSGSPVLWAHDATQPPIARSVSTVASDTELVAVLEFDAADPRSMEFWGRVERGYITATSIRWIPIETATERINGKEVLVFRKSELVEVSFVSVPSDVNAVVVRADAPDVALTRADFNGNGAVLTRPASRVPAPAGATDRMLHPYERAWTAPGAPQVARREAMRVNMELAGMLLGARAAHDRASTHDGRTWQPWMAGEGFLAAWRATVLEERPQVIEGGHTHTRAMDSAETGYGLELVGTAFQSELWKSARSRDLLLDMVPRVQASRGENTIATDGALPEMLLVSEHTAANDTAYATRKWATAKQVTDGAKFTVQVQFSGELREDSIVNFVPTLREQVFESYRKYLASAYLNGDTSTTSNISLVNSTPAATKHYLAFDGMRHAALVENANQSRAAGGAPVTLALIDHLRDLLASVDTGGGIDTLTDVDWGAEPNDLLIICDRRTYQLMAATIPQFTALERYGGAGDGRAGELGRIGAVRVYAPSFAVQAGLDGKVSSLGNNFGALTLINTRGWRGVQTGGLTFLVDRVQGRDQFLAEFYTRQALARHSDNVVAHLYGIGV